MPRLTVESCSLRLVETLKGTVVTLVESPSLHYRDVMEMEFFSEMVESLDRSLEHTSEDYVKRETSFLQSSTSFLCLLVTSHR